MSNQTVAGFDTECTLVSARCDVKSKRGYTTVDLFFRNVWLDLPHYGTDRASRDDSFLHWYQRGGLELHDESDDLDSRALAVVFALIVFKVRREWKCPKQRLEL
jgi:hypothetical protein